MEAAANPQARDYRVPCVLLTHLLGGLSGLLSGLSLRDSNYLDGVGLWFLAPGAIYGLFILLPISFVIDQRSVILAYFAGVAANVVAMSLVFVVGIPAVSSSSSLPFFLFPIGPLSAMAMVGILAFSRAWRVPAALVWVVLASIYGQVLSFLMLGATCLPAVFAVAQASTAGPLGLVLARGLRDRVSRPLQ